MPDNERAEIMPTNCFRCTLFSCEREQFFIEAREKINTNGLVKMEVLKRAWKMCPEKMQEYHENWCEND